MSDRSRLESPLICLSPSIPSQRLASPTIYTAIERFRIRLVQQLLRGVCHRYLHNEQRWGFRRHLVVICLSKESCKASPRRKACQPRHRGSNLFYSYLCVALPPLVRLWLATELAERKRGRITPRSRLSGSVALPASLGKIGLVLGFPRRARCTSSLVASFGTIRIGTLLLRLFGSVVIHSRSSARLATRPPRQGKQRIPVFCIAPGTTQDAATRRGSGRLDLPFFDLLFRSQPPRLRATAVQARRNSSARARSTMVRATTMPPIAKAAMLCAVMRRWRPFSIKLRSKTLTIALKTVWKARFALMPLRATSVGNATMGQEFSTSSKCCRDR